MHPLLSPSAPCPPTTRRTCARQSPRTAAACSTRPTTTAARRCCRWAGAACPACLPLCWLVVGGGDWPPLPAAAVAPRGGQRCACASPGPTAAGLPGAPRAPLRACAAPGPTCTTTQPRPRRRSAWSTWSATSRSSALCATCGAPTSRPPAPPASPLVSRSASGGPLPAGLLGEGCRSAAARPAVRAPRRRPCYQRASTRSTAGERPRAPAAALARRSRPAPSLPRRRVAGRAPGAALHPGAPAALQPRGRAGPEQGAGRAGGQ